MRKKPATLEERIQQASADFWREFWNSGKVKPGRREKTLQQHVSRIRPRIDYIIGLIETSKHPYKQAKKSALDDAETHFGVDLRTIERDWQAFEPYYLAMKKLEKETAAADQALAQLSKKVTTRN